VTSLSPNSITYPSALLAIPAGMTGAQTYKVMVDPDGTIAESSETNNQAEKSLQVGTAAYDLTATSLFDECHDPTPGHSMTITAKFKNQGNATAGNVTLRLLVNGVKIGERTGVSMAANNETDVERQLPGAGGLFRQPDHQISCGSGQFHRRSRRDE